MISCKYYDYIEVACLFKYKIRLTLQSGIELQGIAIDTAKNSKQQECIRLKIDTEHELVVLDLIFTMEVLAENPQFKLIHFNE